MFAVFCWFGVASDTCLTMRDGDVFLVNNISTNQPTVDLDQSQVPGQGSGVSDTVDGSEIRWFQPLKGWNVKKSSSSNGRNDLTGTGSLPSTVPFF